MPENKKTTRKFSVVVPEGVYENLAKAAREKHTTIADVVRSFISKGLTVEWAEGSENFIRGIVREETENVTKHYTERLIRLIVKAAKGSLSALYLLLLLIQNEYANEATTEDILSSAFKQAAGYLKLKEQNVEEYIKDAREFITASKKIGRKEDG
ncbi:MAG: hypothetical protein HFE79_07780 [Ruminiclostridium sp.]|nr:hypothetical protein [Ruminiclostridium sp.]